MRSKRTIDIRLFADMNHFLVQGPPISEFSDEELTEYFKWIDSWATGRYTVLYKTVIFENEVDATFFSVGNKYNDRYTRN